MTQNYIELYINTFYLCTTMHINYVLNHTIGNVTNTHLYGLNTNTHDVLVV